MQKADEESPYFLTGFFSREPEDYDHNPVPSSGNTSETNITTMARIAW